jgi:hypothetical protein
MCEDEKKEGQKNRERVRQKVLVIKDPLKRPFHRKKRTPLR